MNDEWESVRKDAIISLLKILSQHKLTGSRRKLNSITIAGHMRGN
jgi:hypothetical protein